MPDGDAFIRQSPTSRLAAISQSHTLKQAFHYQLKNCCWQHGAKAWRKWDSWCCEWEISSVHAPIEAILEFLTTAFNSGKAYRTLIYLACKHDCLWGKKEGGRE